MYQFSEKKPKSKQIKNILLKSKNVSTQKFKIMEKM